MRCWFLLKSYYWCVLSMGRRTQLLPALESWPCMSFQLCVQRCHLGAWSQPWWEYCHHENQHTLQSGTVFPRGARKWAAARAPGAWELQLCHPEYRHWVSAGNVRVTFPLLSSGCSKLGGWRKGGKMKAGPRYVLLSQSQLMGWNMGEVERAWDKARDKWGRKHRACSRDASFG